MWMPFILGPYDTVDGFYSCTTWDLANLVNNGINYQPQLVQDFGHQQYDMQQETDPIPPEFMDPPCRLRCEDSNTISDRIQSTIFGILQDC